MKTRGDWVGAFVIAGVIACAIGLVPLMFGSTGRQDAKKAATRAMLTNIEAALERYRADNGVYPARLDDLLQDLPRRYLKGDRLMDAWQTPFGYRSEDGQTFELWSEGPDPD